MNCVGSSEYVIVFTSFTRARVPKIDHFVILLPHYSLCKMSNNGNISPLFKILFFKKYLDLFKTGFFCTVQIKDSCIVDIEDRRFYLLFLRLFTCVNKIQDNE